MALDSAALPGGSPAILFRVGRVELAASLGRPVETLRDLDDDEIIELLDGARMTGG